MAWRSSGSTNQELVDNLKRFGVIQSINVEEAFRSVDRKYFVPQDQIGLAHRDMPIREGRVHISAPHIYGTVLEALELETGSAITFLNLGSGTGYLSCLVSQLVGPTSTVYGIELCEEVILHCQEATARWKASLSPRNSGEVAQQEYIEGNALEIDASLGEAAVGFDRIYIGAAIERNDLPKIAQMLKPGGIMVGPVGDELVKILRIAKTSTVPPSADSGRSLFLPRSFRGHRPLLSDDFSTSLLSGVRFSQLSKTPSKPVVIKSCVWDPTLHHLYPATFRRTAREIMLCSHAPAVQMSTDERSSAQTYTNAAATVPRAVWMEILSYTRRDWFEPPQTDVSRLRKRVTQLEVALQRAQEARMDMERMLRIMEGERDLYREMSRTWQARAEGFGGVVGYPEMLQERLVAMRNDEDSDDSHQSFHDSDEDESHSDVLGDLPDMEEESEAESMSLSPPDGSEAQTRKRSLQTRTVSISSEDML